MQTPPTIPEKTVEALTEEEEQLMTHLKGLRDMKVQLPEEMADQLATLELKAQAQRKNQILTHGDLNHHKKAKAKVDAAAKKLKYLDVEWAQFVKGISSEFQEHAMLYQTARQEHMEVYNQRLQELNALKESLDQASKSLLAKEKELNEVQEINVEQQLTEFQETLRSAASTAQVYDLTGDEDFAEELEDMEVQDLGKEEESEVKDAVSAKPPRKVNFQGSPSPSRVAQQNLKPKAKKEGSS